MLCTEYSVSPDSEVYSDLVRGWSRAVSSTCTINHAMACHAMPTTKPVSTPTHRQIPPPPSCLQLINTINNPNHGRNPQTCPRLGSPARVVAPGHACHQPSITARRTPQHPDTALCATLVHPPTSLPRPRASDSAHGRTPGRNETRPSCLPAPGMCTLVVSVPCVGENQLASFRHAALPALLRAAVRVSLPLPCRPRSHGRLGGVLSAASHAGGDGGALASVVDGWARGAGLSCCLPSPTQQALG